MVGVHEWVVRGNGRRKLGALALGRSPRRVDRGRRLVAVAVVVVAAAAVAVARIGGHCDEGTEIEDHRVARTQLALYLVCPETTAQKCESAEG